MEAFVFVNRPCRCCGRDRAIFNPPRNIGDIPQAPIACGLCERHLGHTEIDLKRQVKDHNEMWREDLQDALQEQADAHASVVASYEQRIADMQTELDERPIQVVNKYVGQGLIDAAQNDAERAFRSRDNAFHTLALLHMYHYEAKPGTCRCGRAINACDAAGILDVSGALKGWERKQHQRRERGQSHRLPRGHPGVVDARWEPDEDDGLLAEFRDL